MGTAALSAATRAAGEPCCGAARRPTFSDYVDRGLWRRRRERLPVRGDVRHDEAGRSARFSLHVDRGVVTDVVFEASYCPTLVAYCEVAATLVTGRPAGEAATHLRLQQVVGALPGVPADKRDRARLAVQALVQALGACAMEDGT